MQFDPLSQRIVYTREDRSGLWAASLDLQDLGALRKDLPLVHQYRAWRVFDGHLWWLHGEHEAAGLALHRLPLAGLDGAPQTVIELQVQGRLISDIGLSLGTEGVQIWHTLQSLPEADIAMLSLSSGLTEPNAGLTSR